MISLFVLIDGLVDDVLRKQVVAVGIGLEPVADKLLVEGRLAVAGLITFEGPEAAAVGCEHLVAEHYFAVLVEAELELGIRDDDASCERVVRALLVERDGAVADGLCVFLAVAGECFLEDLDALLKADVRTPEVLRGV